LLSQLQGVVVGENPREGFVQNGVFYHPDMKFKFNLPRGWKVKNDKSAVLMGEPNQRAMMALELTRAKSAKEAAQAMANTQGIKVIEGAPTRVNGQQAYQVLAQANTQQGAASLMAYFIEHGGRVFSFTGLTSANNLRTYRNEFEQTFRGFSELTDSRMLAVQPSRVQIMVADRTAPFTSFLPTSDVPGMTAEDLAILNQVSLRKRFPPGRKSNFQVLQRFVRGKRGKRRADYITNLNTLPLFPVSALTPVVSTYNSPSSSWPKANT
jgi:predicted Zn-dependent protease